MVGPFDFRAVREALSAILEGTCLSARKLSPGKEQNCAKEGNQHPARVCLWNGPNIVALIVVALIILLGIRQDRESQSSG